MGVRIRPLAAAIALVFAGSAPTSASAQIRPAPVGLENALDKQYASPLGGAYIGQGATMSLNGSGAPYGLAVPGMGRSLYAAVNLRF